MFKYHSVPAARTRSTSLGAASVLLAIILSACGQTGTNQADTPAAPPLLAGGSAQAPGSAKLPGKTRVLTSFAGGTLTHLSAKGTLTFDRPMMLPVRSAGISALKVDDVTGLNPGDVLMSAPTDTAPYGFIRKVENVEGSNGAIVVTTSPATLQDAIKGSGLSAGKYKITKAIPTDRVIAQSVVGQDGKLVAQGLPVFGDEHTEAGFYSIPLPQKGIKSLGSVDVSTGNQCVKVYLNPAPGFSSGKVSANVCYSMNAQVTLDLQVSVGENDWWVPTVNIDSFSSQITGDASNSIDFKTGYTLEVFEAKAELAQVTFDPIVVLIGEIPVVIVPEYNVSITTSGRITANASYSVAATAHAEIGARYTRGNGWEPINDLTGKFTPDISITERRGISFTDSFDNTASVKFYGIAGPAFTFSTYATAYHSGGIFLSYPGLPGSNPKGTVVGGVSGYVSMDVDPLFSLFDGSGANAYFVVPVFSKEWQIGEF